MYRNHYLYPKGAHPIFQLPISVLQIIPKHSSIKHCIIMLTDFVGQKFGKGTVRAGDNCSVVSGILQLEDSKPGVV